MPDDELLLVMIVREAGLRSALAARVAMAGANSITAGALDDPQLDRLRVPAVLLVDADRVDSAALAWVAADPRWRMVVLVGEAGPPELPPKLERIPAARIVAELPALLERLSG